MSHVRELHTAATQDRNEPQPPKAPRDAAPGRPRRKLPPGPALLLAVLISLLLWISLIWLLPRPL